VIISEWNKDSTITDEPQLSSMGILPCASKPPLLWPLKKNPAITHNKIMVPM